MKQRTAKWGLVWLSLLLALLLLLCSGCAEEFIPSDNMTTTASTTITTETDASATASSTTVSTTKQSTSQNATTGKPPANGTVSLQNIPSYAGKPYVVIDNNVPTFQESEHITVSFERYEELDALGRCGVTYACVGRDLMPTEDRGSIGQVKPSGWQTVKYDIVDGKYLYNRCHLIGFQLTGENANRQNLITGTRYLNVDGMLPFENMVADYVKETGNHVLYRVTPIFEEDELVARGVWMEAWSVEDDGDGICFSVYCYNVQPGITICYADGTSSPDDEVVTTKKTTTTTKKTTTTTKKPTTSVGAIYILNTNTKKFHDPHCGSVGKIKEENRGMFTGDRQTLIKQGYEPCGVCKP